MRIAHKTGTALLGGLLCLAGGVSAASASSCTDLENFRPTLGGKAVIGFIYAADETSGSFDTPSGSTLTGLPAFCRVTGIMASNGDFSQSQVNFELWLPETGWNGRYVGFGNGGFAGAISYPSLQLGLTQGFAAANNDLGTGLLFGCNTVFCGNHAGAGGPPGGLYGDPAAIRDFGFAATHEMTVAAKQFVTQYYSQKASYSYFNGCSTGGQQALMESQRFPDDYDGILAGAPAHNRTHLHMGGPAVYEVTHFAADAYLTTAALSLIHAHVLAQCAGQDGGLASDLFLTLPASCTASANPLICSGSPSEIPCTDRSATSCTCITPDQALAMNHDWQGVYDTNGQRMYPGLERGTEDPTDGTGIGLQEQLSEPIFDGLMFWALGPDWVWQEMFSTPSVPERELASEIAAVDNAKVGGSTFAQVLNANSTNLSAFASHNHRMLMYQGYTDPLIPSATAIDYYNAVAAADPNVNAYLRLFMAPGVWHCNGGPGANVFGNLGAMPPPYPLAASDDAFGALMAWVEQGVPPTTITATKYVNDTPSQGIAFQRPLCLYPSHSVYVKGTNPANAASFACVLGKPVTNQSFSPQYGP